MSGDLYARHCGQRRGFTLLETVLSAAIVGVLAALLLPAVGAARAAAARSTCRSHLRQVGMAFRLYQADYGELPDPVKLTGSIRDRRLLVCPADLGERAARSSYAFRIDTPPDFRPYWERSAIDDTAVIAVCNQHLERPRGKDGTTRAGALPGHPFKLVLRAGGEVQEVPLGAIREVLKKDTDRPVLVRIYPGEKGYNDGRSGL